MSVFYYDNHGNTYLTHYDAMVSPHPTWFYFHDRELLAMDWAKEPVEDIETLYRRRAQWIRDNYDYVILACSGGIDSAKVLEVFYYNNVHFDEVLTVGAFSQDSKWGSDENHNGEIYTNLLDTLRQMHLPRTKVTQLDYTKYFDKLEALPLVKKAGVEWYKDVGDWLSVHMWFWDGLSALLPREGRVAVVFGDEKQPAVWRDPKTMKFCVHFRSDNYTCYGGSKHDAGDYRRVRFFTELESMDVVRKQCHMIVNLWKAGLVLTNENITKLLYGRLRHPLKFTSKKSVTNVLSVRDMYLLKHKNSLIYDVYREGIKRYHKEFYPAGGPIVKMQPIFTRKYYLE